MDSRIDPTEIEVLRSMTPAEKRDVVCALYETAVELRIAGLRNRQPDWPRDKLELEARRAMLYSAT